ncbi:MAG: hypothetical protein AABX16_05670 [Nanoarchaeota archaeon]
MEEINFEIIFADSYLELANEAYQKRLYTLSQELALNAYGFFKRENQQDKMLECREYFCDEQIKNAGEIIVEMDGLFRMMNKVKEVHSRFILHLSLYQRKKIVKNTLIKILGEQGYRNIF